MAIQKSKTLPNGVTGDYWRITTIHIDRQNLRVAGQVALFLDQAASNTGKQPIGAHKTFRFPFVAAEIAPPTNLIAYVYGKIIAQAEAVITKDIRGNDLPEPTTFDPDLTGGIQV